MNEPLEQVSAYIAANEPRRADQVACGKRSSARAAPGGRISCSRALKECEESASPLPGSTLIITSKQGRCALRLLPATFFCHFFPQSSLVLAGFLLVAFMRPLPSYSQSATDATLNAVRSSDRADRNEKVMQISAAEHMRRAAVYMANRAFAPAREHWQAVVDNYPNDVNIPAALYGMARSYYQERRYEDARQTYERVGH